MSRFRFLISLGSCVALFLAGAASGADLGGFGFYQEYLRTAAKAEKLSDVADYMPSWWRSRYASADAESQKAAVERLRKIAAHLTDVVLESNESADGGVRLAMKAKDQNGAVMVGDVLLVKEGGKFTVEESKWATAP